MDLESTDLRNIKKLCTICLSCKVHTYREHKAAIRKLYMREYMRENYDKYKGDVAYSRGSYKRSELVEKA